MTEWILENIIPLLALLASTLVIFLQIRLQQKFQKESVVFSHNYKMQAEGIDAINESLGTLHTTVGSALSSLDSPKILQMFLNQSAASLNKANESVNRYEIYMSPQARQLIGTVHGLLTKLMRFCYEYGEATIDQSDENSRVLLARLKDLIEEHNIQFENEITHSLKELQQVFRTELNRV